MNLETLEALAFSDRAAAFAQLSPGSEDADRWRVIHHQQRGELDAADVILKGWRHGAHGAQALRRRQLVLRADRDLGAHADDLARELGVRTDFPRRAADAPATAPSSYTLPDATELLALGRDADSRGLRGFTDEGIRHLPFGDGSDVHVARIRRGGLPGLVDALAADLAAGVRAFGALPVHRELTDDELDALAALRPDLRRDEAWVVERLARDLPPDDVDLELDAVARDAWLTALGSWVAPLPAVFAELKAHVGLHHLRTDRDLDRTDEGRVLAYLRLPRRTGTTKSRADVPASHVAQLDGRDFSRATGQGPIRDDAELVRHHVAALLARGVSPAVFDGLVESGWLRALAAEVELLADGAAAEAAARRLGTSALEALRARVDIELAAHTPRRFGSDDPVVCDVFAKNAWPLRLRVFRVDDAAAFAQGLPDPPTTLDVDGLRPLAEREIAAPTTDPLRRVRLRVDVPECDRPGTWLVDLEGNGLVARMVVRRGDLRAVTRITAAGVEVRVIDDRGAQRSDAVVVVGATRRAAHADGTVTLPFGSGSTRALLVAGDLAVATVLDLPSEYAALSLAVTVDRATLTPGRAASLLARVTLTLAGAPAPLALLEDAWLEVTTLDRTGVPSTRRTPAALRDDEDVVIPFAVPEHLAAVGVAVGGRVRIRTQQRHEVLRAEGGFTVGERLATDDVIAPFFRADPGDAIVALRGRNGEVVGGREVTLRLHHRWLRDPLVATLATDAVGEVHLGPLPGVRTIGVEVADAAPASFEVASPEPGPRGSGVFAGEPLTVPWRGPWRVVALRRGVPSAQIEAGTSSGSVTLRLPAGRFRLEGEDREWAFAIAPGARPEHGLHLGTSSTNAPRPAPTVVDVVADGDGVVITTAHATPDTRIHVWSAPLAPDPAGDPDLGAPSTPSPSRGHAPRTTVALAARDLGDEARYVRDRARAPRRPGSLLEKPSLLSNPWALRATTTVALAARPAASWGAPAPAPPAGAAAYAAEMLLAESDAEYGGGQGPLGPWWDFLAAGGGVVANLRPDQDGRVAVARSEVPGAVVVVLLVDPDGTERRELRLPAPSPGGVDRRLRAALPAGRSFVEARRLQTEAPSDPASRTRRVDTLHAAYTALCAACPDPTLAAWDFLGRWDAMTSAERLAAFDAHACHELVVFAAHRDPAWFAATLRPYVADKLQPDLVDDLVCGRSLDQWVTPWRMARMDAVELALLARARPDLRASVVRALADIVETLPRDPEADDRFVDTLLGGSGETPPSPPAELPDDDSPAEPAPKQAPARRAAAMGGGGRSRSSELAKREESQEAFRPPDRTMEWAETAWWRCPREGRGPARVTPTRFWRDLAAHGDGPFLSPHLVDAARSFTEAVVALGVLGVPEAPLFAVATLSRVDDPPSGTVLVGQHLVRADDRVVWEGGEARERHVGDEVVRGVRYVAVTAVTNPTSRGRSLGVLVQIPQGAVPTGGAVPTRTHRVTLAPWATTTLETSFVFPAAGAFAWHGARVADGPRIAAAAPDRALTAVDRATTNDGASWPYVSQEAPLDEVVAYLDTANLHRTPLADLAWRMRDRAAFDTILAVLARHGAYDATLWGHAWLHRDRARAREWLLRQPQVGALGPLNCAWLTIDAPGEHLEYAPLVVARAHRLGGQRRLPNDAQDAHWRSFLEQVATAGGPTATDQLRAAHHLFAMDRPEEARERLSAAGDGPGHTVQRAWLRAFERSLAMDWPSVRAAVAPWLDHPVPRWRGRFLAFDAMLRELDGGGPATSGDGRDARMAELASRSPSVHAELDGDRVVLRYANLPRVEIRVHELDLELSFSRDPFGGGAGRVGQCEPRLRYVVELPAGGDVVSWPVPDEVRRADVAIEVVAGPLRQVVTRLPSSLQVTAVPAYGQLRVTRGGAPVPAAYVKVYARSRGGAVTFYKDGYTDPLGRFDHASVSTDELARTERFAVLVRHDDGGGVIVEVAPPG